MGTCGSSHGSQTKLPRRYISRQRLCLRGTTDYWVNALDGQPFFVITKVVDPGLVKVVLEEIVPRLEDQVPELGEEELLEDPLRHLFTVCFDREGYSPVLFAELWRRHIACLTYRKGTYGDWPITEFSTETVTLVGGEQVQMQLAERGTYLESGKLWVREIRRLTESGHQTSIVATDYKSDCARLAARMFGRWGQENFFRYMREHYGLDRIITNSLESIPETTEVVNPAYRDLDNSIRRKNGLLSRRRAKFAALGLEPPIGPKVVERWEIKKAALLEEMTTFELEVVELKTQRKATPRKLAIKDLPPEHRFEQLNYHSKHFIDTIKMIAYRAETAMVHVLRDVLSRSDDARSHLRSIYTNEADIIPDHEARTLTVRLHHLANRAADTAVRYLCAQLTATETLFPETDLRLIYELGGAQDPQIVTDDPDPQVVEARDESGVSPVC